MTRASLQPRHAERSGFSLLEVLVACGILVLGLASVAAMMPAAGARLGEASAQDRAASAVANAFVEISARGLVSKNLFLSQTSPTAAVFGAVPAMPVVHNLFVPDVPATEWLAARIDLTRGFFLEDELVYLSTPDDVPENSIVGVGRREFNPGVCWAAMVSPDPWLTPPDAMKAARVSVAVFRKPPTDTEAVIIDLQQAAANLFNVTSAPFDDAARKTLLKPCGFVLAVPKSPGTAAPRWLEINSSWVKKNPVTEELTPQVSFRAAEDDYQALMEGIPKEMRVIGFDQLITVSEQIMAVSQ